MKQTTTIKEEEAERSIRARWPQEAELRAEFGGDLATCIAYHKAEARGAAKLYGGRGVSLVKPEKVR